MQRERVSENIYWFQSEFYAQVTAGAVIGPQWAVLIDTLIPQETAQIKDCLLYTSDAADDLLCVDLGGRRIIKKKKERYQLTMSLR